MIMKRLCAGGCRKVVTKGRCSQCQLKQDRRQNRDRGNSTQRGYDYKHQQQRKRLLVNDWCTRCGATQGPFHADHIIPLSAGGTNDDDNYQLLCSSCNLDKSNKIDW